MRRRRVVESLGYWFPLALGLAFAAPFAHHGLKPAGIAVVLAVPALGALAVACRVTFVARLVLAAQVCLGVFATTFWAAVKLLPPVAMFEGRPVAVMATGHLAFAMLAAFVLAPVWAFLPSTRARSPGLAELAWLMTTAIVTGLAAAV